MNQAPRTTTSLNRTAQAVLAMTAALWAASAAHAVALTVPTPEMSFADTALPGTRSADRPELAGTVLADKITPFSFQGITGTVQNRVVKETASGTLDFYWKVDVDSDTSGLGVSALRVTNFGAANLTDADWRKDGLGTVAPDTARLFNSASSPRGSLNFLFDNMVDAGESSRFFFLHTNSTEFAETAKFDLLTGGPQNLSGVYTTYAPVPEPSTYALGLVGMGVVGLMLRRRRMA